MGSKFTQHEKLRKIKDDSQSIGAFIEWLRGDRNLVLASHHEHTEDCGHIPRDVINYPAECGYCQDDLQVEYIGIQQLLAEYFEINLAELEQERQAMLAELRG